MMEINRHIEILLLSHDCVIVPGLGGFMAHHQNARYDESDHMFVPPLRTLGFNAQLSMSDPLLAQSYADAYDISYPEAVGRVESDVLNIKQELEHNGSYEFTDIGTLRLTESGTYTYDPNTGSIALKTLLLSINGYVKMTSNGISLLFESQKVGILSPGYYGLSTFEMPTLAVPFVQSTPASALTALHTPIHSQESMSEENHKDKEEKTISIKVSLLRNLAVAGVAAAALLFFARPIDPSSVSESQPTEASAGILTQMMPKDVTTGTPEFTSLMSKVAAFSERVDQANGTVNAPTSGSYTIVLAYRVPLENAKIFVKNLHDNGINGAQLINYKNDNVVVYGSYKSQEEALPALNELVKSDCVTDGWIMLVE